LWGLAAGGYDGVDKAYNILKVELDRAMGLLGTATVVDLKREGPSLIKRRPGSARDFPDKCAPDRGYGGGII
jgi:L-lactate dehydrogenase (cytochrome)